MEYTALSSSFIESQTVEPSSLILDSAEELCGQGDVIHIETPLNPTGEVRPIAKFASLARDRGAFVVVDATFGQPSL